MVDLKVWLGIVREDSSYIVSTSTSDNPGRADYKADGTADQTEINAAITAAGT